MNRLGAVGLMAAIWLLLALAAVLAGFGGVLLAHDHTHAFQPRSTVHPAWHAADTGWATLALAYVSATTAALLYVHRSMRTVGAGNEIKEA